MQPGAVRPDNQDTRPDFYTEIGGQAPSTGDAGGPLEYPASSLDQEERSGDRDRTDLGEPSEDKGFDR
jgi:hypothetical protein